jgi:hypothetical protein
VVSCARAGTVANTRARRGTMSNARMDILGMC